MPQYPLFGTSNVAAPLSQTEELRRRHEAMRTEFVELADSVLRDIANWDELPSVKEAVAKMVAHPSDSIARLPVNNVTFDYFLLKEKPTMKMPSTGKAAYLIVYRVQVGRETGFALFDHRECAYLRAQAFVNFLLPADSFNDPEVEESYGHMQLLLDTIAHLSPSLTT